MAALLLLSVVYLLLRPFLVERFGLPLPGFTDVQPKSNTAAPVTPPRGRDRPVEVPVIPEQGEPVVEDQAVASSAEATEPSTSTEPAAPETSNKPSSEPQESTAADSSASPTPRRVDPPQRTPAKPPITRTPPTAPTKPAPPAVAAQKPPPKPPGPGAPAAEAGKPKLVVLKPLGRDRFESTAGLVYSKYRIDHVMEHSHDNTDKPSHGVYDVSTQAEVLALVDEAYEMSKKGKPPQVIIEDEGARTTYTVNMNRKIGRAGGQSGARNRNPPLKKVKIVLEGNEVITAYPTN